MIQLTTHKSTYFFYFPDEKVPDFVNKKEPDYPSIPVHEPYFYCCIQDVNIFQIKTCDKPG